MTFTNMHQKSLGMNRKLFFEMEDKRPATFECLEDEL